MISKVFVLVSLLKLRQLLECPLVHSPHFPVPWTRSAHKLWVFRREADPCYLEASAAEVTAGNNFLLVTIPLIDHGLGVVVII